MTKARIALVTGAGKRIGSAIARDLAQDGWTMLLHCNRSRNDAETLAGQIRAGGGQADVVAADLANLDEVMALLPRCAELAGAPPTCLVNNASLFQKDEIGSLDAVLWQAHMDVNLRAPVFLAQAMAEALPKGASGNIVNIIDQRVLKPSPGFMSYTASKAALWWMTRTMAQALAPRIRVNAVAPGPTLQSVHQTQSEFDAERRATLLGEGASPEQIAAAVRFILATPSMTGGMLTLDGGQHLT